MRDGSTERSVADINQKLENLANSMFKMRHIPRNQIRSLQNIETKLQELEKKFECIKDLLKTEKDVTILNKGRVMKENDYDQIIRIYDVIVVIKDADTKQLGKLRRVVDVKYSTGTIGVETETGISYYPLDCVHKIANRVNMYRSLDNILLHGDTI